MEIVIVDSDDSIGQLGANAIEQLMARSAKATLGLATGSSPLPIYRELVKRHDQRQLSFANIKAFLLDEYVGLEANHPQAYRRFIVDNFQGSVDLQSRSLFGPDGAADDLLAECVNYEAKIAKAGGIDLQLLGIGSDGHVGFNEPTSSLGSRTRIKTLTESTRIDNARFFDNLDEVPRHVITQGLGTILESAHAIMVAMGGSKAEPIAAAVEGPMSASCPASVLQLHPHATVIIDNDAASRLRDRDYYRKTLQSKPDWQGL